MGNRIRAIKAAAVAVTLLVGVVATAQTDAQKFREAVLKLVSDRNPEVRVSKVDHDALRVRRIDIVDEKGVIRMTIAASLPDPIIDGIAYKRVAPVSGIMLRDDRGNERGGIGYMAGHESMVMMIDHRTSEAAGFTSLKDGSSAMVLNSPAPEMREPALGDRLIPGQNKTRIRLGVKPDGTPEVFLTDKEERPRLRLTITDEGHGALQFLNARGEVIQTLAPESA
jgi:hypothetical protein